MPLTYSGNVPFSEMQASKTTHQGPRTAGNKGLLTFRSDIGIPGYTGYAPGWCTVPVPITGSTQHIGRLPHDSQLLAATAAKSGQHQATTEYRSTFQADPTAYQPPTKTGGGFWFEERQRKAAGNIPPMLGTSTYAAEVLQGAATAAQQLEQSQGVNSTLITYQAARGKRLHSADPQLHSDQLSGSSMTRTSKGDLIGYRTTYSSTTALVAEAAAAAATAALSPSSSTAPARPRSCSTLHQQHQQQQQQHLSVASHAAGQRRFESSTSYGRDYGQLGSDPMIRAAIQPTEQVLLASTRDLNLGSTRASRHVPGYTGFIPAAAVNEFAVMQGSGTCCRPNMKTNMLPVTLDQFNRGRVTHYTGYKPQAGAGATAMQPAHGPTTETTQGFVNLQVLKHGPQPRDPTHCINSRKGIMTFFSGGGESVSDNGEADAQRFFCRLRPLEGRMKV